MLCSLNGLRSVKNHLFILSRQFRFFNFIFPGNIVASLESWWNTWKAFSHPQQQAGGVTTTNREDTSVRDRVPVTHCQRTKKRAFLPRGLPAEFVELVCCGFFWVGYMNPCRCSTKQRRVNIFATGYTRKRTYASERQLKKHLSMSVESFGATGF